MRNASLATRGERAATLRRRAVSPLFCASPLSHPLSLPLRLPSFVFLLLLLLALSFSHSFFSALLFPSTRGLSLTHSLTPPSTSSDRLFILLFFLLFVPTFEYVCTSAAVRSSCFRSTYPNLPLLLSFSVFSLLIAYSFAFCLSLVIRQAYLSFSLTRDPDTLLFTLASTFIRHSSRLPSLLCAPSFVSFYLLHSLFSSIYPR